MLDQVKQLLKDKLLHLSVFNSIKPESKTRFIDEADDKFINLVVGLVHDAMEQGKKFKDSAAVKKILASDDIEDAKENIKSGLQAGNGFLDDLGDIGESIFETTFQDILIPAATGALIGKLSGSSKPQHK